MLHRLKGLFLAALMAGGTAAPSVAADSSLAEIQQRGSVRIGVLTGAPPMGMVDEKGNPSGYDVDVANLIGTYLGLPVELVPLTVTPRISALQANKVDFLVATLAPTGERAKQVMFTAPYSAFSNVIISGAAQKFETFADLAGKTVAANRGSPSETVLRAANIEGINIVLFEDDATVAQAIISGQADAAALPSTVANAVIKQAPNLQVGFTFLKQGNSMAVRLGDYEMLQYLNTAIYLMKVSGDLDAISEKWTGEPVIELPSF